ncbi:uncharacterized protein [Rutidosis leptorrhynchoides]|uniref:uncharacterized protein n=1 Tax=Rutidosis leptorrhynchoides TaxID=125765 RepID=UPI003A99D641
MLDSCGRTKDILILVKTHIQELQSTFHRITLGVQTSSSEKKLSAYHLHRKDLRKQMLKRLKSLKITKNSTTANNDSDDDNLTVVSHVLDDVRETITSLVESLMLLMSMPSPNPKARRSINFNGIVAAKAKFMRVNSLSRWDKCDVQAVRQAIERLEAVESAVEDLEVELEYLRTEHVSNCSELWYDDLEIRSS